MRHYAVGLGFVALAGCSFAFVSGPPPNHQQLSNFDCTTNLLVPILDTVWTGLQASNLVFALAQSNTEWDEQFAPNEAPFSRKAGIGLYSGFAALGAAGMIYGWSKTRSCRRAKSAWEIRMAGQGAQPGVAPQPGTWPPSQPATAPQPGTWPPPPKTAPAPAPDPSAPAPDPSAPPPPTP